LLRPRLRNGAGWGGPGRGGVISGIDVFLKFVVYLLLDLFSGGDCERDVRRRLRDAIAQSLPEKVEKFACFFVVAAECERVTECFEVDPERRKLLPPLFLFFYFRGYAKNAVEK
jgi:hypothetical protein